MKRILFFSVIMMMVAVFGISAFDFAYVDSLYDNCRYDEALEMLKKEVIGNSEDPAFVWRIGRLMYEAADKLPAKPKEDKIAEFTKAMDYLEPYLNMQNGDKYDRANIIFWYGANFGARGEVIGIKESLSIIPELFNLADKALQIDSSFALPYHLKGRIDMAVPFFLGGDKFRMGINFSKAVKCLPDDLYILVDAATAFYKRNWDVDKKRKVSKDKNETDGTPQNLSDREYAEQLIDRVIKIYKAYDTPVVRDVKKYNEALVLLEKIKK